MLRVHGWDLARLQDAWFEGESRCRQKCGLVASVTRPGPASSSASRPRWCPICMQDDREITPLLCSHAICQDCWRGYLHCSVDEGKASVQTRCPMHECTQVVPAEFFRKFCDETRQSKYEEWHLRSYVDDNPNVKWCTSPTGCDHAVEYQGCESLEVHCSCDFHFCWPCGEEAHRPADCSTVRQWNIKNSAESENISWIMANTKKCPKCHRPIEKNQGCNHMVCSKAGGCGHNFCWLCLGEWSTHGSSTGGYYQCNIYDKQVRDGKHSEEEQDRQKAKNALDKYMFFFERFMDHERGMRLTYRESHDIEQKVQTLHDRHGFEIIELQFLHDGLRQVRDCRRVLKWSYVYGYYLVEGGVEKNLFEHLQRNLEEKVDNLHEMLEKDFDSIYFSQAAASAPGGASVPASPASGPAPPPTSASAAGGGCASPMLTSTSAEMPPEVPRTSSGRISSGGGFVQDGPHAKFMEFRSHVTNFTNVTRKFMAQILTDLGGDKTLTTTTSS